MISLELNIDIVPKSMLMVSGASKVETLLDIYDLTNDTNFKNDFFKYCAIYWVLSLTDRQ